MIDEGCRLFNPACSKRICLYKFASPPKLLTLFYFKMCVIWSHYFSPKHLSTTYPDRWFRIFTRFLFRRIHYFIFLNTLRKTLDLLICLRLKLGESRFSQQKSPFVSKLRKKTKKKRKLCTYRRDDKCSSKRGVFLNQKTERKSFVYKKLLCSIDWKTIVWNFLFLPKTTVWYLYKRPFTTVFVYVPFHWEKKTNSQIWIQSLINLAEKMPKSQFENQIIRNNFLNFSFEEKKAFLYANRVWF